ncbi:hypothetical protein [Nocardia sp. NBC_00403]|uniref:hypothetical protein n=1 Tax=Nocardia sp. NBC_00403 TaxID=2975990 RepID=UPI002E20D7B4
MIHISTPQCRRLADAVTQVGGTVPAELQQIIASLDAVAAWSPTPPPNVESAIASGKFTAKNAAALLDAALSAPSVESGAVRRVAEQQLALKFRQAVRGSAGDAIIEGLRPAFETASAGVRAAANAGLTVDTTADQVLEMGAEAVAAWQDIVEHRRVLDAIHEQVISALAATHEFDVIGVKPWMQVPIWTLIVAFYVPSENTDIERAARAITPEHNGGRGGRWLRLLTSTEMKLNTVSRAREIVDHHTAAIAEAAQRHYDATHSFAS